MERVYTPLEIESLVRAAHGSPSPNAEPRSIAVCTFQAGQLGSEQVSSVKALHAAFARSLSESLGAYLRVAFDANLVSAEQLTYGEVLGRVPEITYMMRLRIEQTGAMAAMQIDHALLFPLIDILLGGTGACEVPPREISEIEEQIMEEVARIICSELDAAWAPLGANLSLDGRQLSSQMRRLLPSTEKTLYLSFEIKLSNASGKINLIIPVSTSSALLRKLASHSKDAPAQASRRIDGQMTSRMLDCSFPAQLGIIGIKLPIETLVRLRPGGLYNLGIAVRNPASLLIAGREVFPASPVRYGRHRAAQIAKSTAASSREGK